MLIVGRWLLGRMRRRTFYSLAEVDAALGELMAQLNEKYCLRRLGVTRRQVFEEVDRPALKALPSEPYEYCSGVFVGSASTQGDRRPRGTALAGTKSEPAQARPPRQVVAQSTLAHRDVLQSRRFDGSRLAARSRRLAQRRQRLSRRSFGGGDRAWRACAEATRRRADGPLRPTPLVVTRSPRPPMGARKGEGQPRLGGRRAPGVEWSSSQLLQNTPLRAITEWDRQRFGAPAEQRLADLETPILTKMAI
jgi:hypothetical protein